MWGRRRLLVALFGLLGVPVCAQEPSKPLLLPPTFHPVQVMDLQAVRLALTGSGYAGIRLSALLSNNQVVSNNIVWSDKDILKASDGGPDGVSGLFQSLIENGIEALMLSVDTGSRRA